MQPDIHLDWIRNMSQQPPDRSEFEIALSTRRDLGPEMELALVESFAEKVVAEIRRRQAMNLGGMSQTPIPAGQNRVQHHNRFYNAMGLATTSMVLATPLTAIALAYGGTPMGVVIWAGIIGINSAAALGNFKFNDPSSRWRSSNG